MSPHKQIGGLLETNAAGDGRLAFSPQLLDRRQTLSDGAVARFALGGPAQIPLGVLMGAPHPGARPQGAQALQRAQHLLGRALKETSAAAGKEGVAAEQLRRLLGLGFEHIGDVVARVAGHLEHPQVPPE